MITGPPPHKLTHVQARYGVAHGGDRCGNCQAFHGRDQCAKVAPPIAAGGWCAVGVSLVDGHRFDPRGEMIERRFLGGGLALGASGAGRAAGGQAGHLD